MRIGVYVSYLTMTMESAFRSLGKAISVNYSSKDKF
jgi:hypothetical protein